MLDEEEELGSKGLGLGLDVGAENMMPHYGPNPPKGAGGGGGEGVE